jgi:flagellar biosynthesis chaperone FliJ
VSLKTEKEQQLQKIGEIKKKLKTANGELKNLIKYYEKQVIALRGAKVVCDLR